MNQEQKYDGELYTNLTIEEKPGSEIEITGEIPTAVVEATRSKAVRKLQQGLDLPGFRKGHVPEEMVVKHAGEAAILQETAELALSHAYGRMVEERKLNVIGRPAVTITKLAPGNPIGFKITTAVFPEISLPDYAALASVERKKHEDPENLTISEEDLSSELTRLQKLVQNSEMATTNDSADAAHVDKEKKDNKPLPSLDDAFARSLGDFKDLNDLKEKVRMKMLMEKKQKAQDKRRLAVVDSVLAKTKVEVPSVFVEGELDQMVNEFRERVKRAGLELDAYLKETQKTLEDLRKEWQADAEKRAKIQLTLSEIAKKEGITPDEARLAREVAHICEHYPDADEGAVRAFVSAQMINDKVFALLEGREDDSAQ